MGQTTLNAAGALALVALAALEGLRAAQPTENRLLRLYYRYSGNFVGDGPYTTAHITLLISSLFYQNLAVFMRAQDDRAIADAGAAALLGDAVACIVPQLVGAQYSIKWAKNSEVFQNRTILGTLCNFIAQLYVLGPENVAQAAVSSFSEAFSVNDNLLCAMIGVAVHLL